MASPPAGKFYREQSRDRLLEYTGIERLSDGLTFTALGFTNSGSTSRMLGTAAGAIAGSEISNLVSQPLAAALRSPLASGVCQYLRRHGQR